MVTTIGNYFGLYLRLISNALSMVFLWRVMYYAVHVFMIVVLHLQKHGESCRVAYSNMVSNVTLHFIMSKLSYMKHTLTVYEKLPYLI